MNAHDQYASVRYIVDDVQAAIDFYTANLGFTLNTSAAPAFAGKPVLNAQEIEDVVAYLLTLKEDGAPGRMK